MTLRIVFAGTPEFAVPTLQALIDSEHEVIAVYCQPDRPQGRGQTISAGPCKVLAQTHQIPVEQPKTFKEEAAISRLQAYEADIMIVIAYGMILPQIILECPRLGCLNIHASLLPKWRGAAPIQRALQAGDATTGVTLMQMEATLDTGPVYGTASCDILPYDNAQSLAKKLSVLGAELLIASLVDIEHEQITPQSQNHEEASYAHKLSKSEAPIDWTLSAAEIDHHIRAFNPWPVALTKTPKGPLRIFHSQVLDEYHDRKPGTVIGWNQHGIIVAAKEGSVRITSVQLPNHKRMEAYAFAQGQRDWLEGCIFE